MASNQNYEGNYDLIINFKTQFGLSDDIVLNKLGKYADGTVLRVSVMYYDNYGHLGERLPLINGTVRAVGSQLVFIETELSCALRKKTFDTIRINASSPSQSNYESIESRTLVIDLSSLNFSKRYQFDGCISDPIDNQLVNFDIRHNKGFKNEEYNKNPLIRKIDLRESQEGEIYIEKSSRLLSLYRNSNDTNNRNSNNNKKEKKCSIM